MTGEDSTHISQTEDSLAGSLRVQDSDWSAKGCYPRCVIVYHRDLRRIGYVTTPEVFAQPDRWQVFGRHQPLLARIHGGDEEQPLDDPGISRQQFAVRWLSDTECFEVKPLPGAKRTLSLVTFEPFDGSSQACGWSKQELVRPTQVPSGSYLTIGERACLRLEVAHWHDAWQERMGLVGESEQMWRIREEIRDVAKFHRPVLVYGETGTGKELVSRAIHEQSNHSDGPYLTINCAAIPSQLVESVLFGHSKGAFTGASTPSKGLFRAADGGTLLLDEFGELPQLIQPKLLRVLQDGRLTPVGEHQGSIVDVRLIAATNRELLCDVEEQKLRKDLYYRVAAHTIRLPELRERREDLPLLFVSFLEQMTQKHQELQWIWQRHLTQKPAIPLNFMLDLMAYEWPGNVRELQNVVEQVACLNLRPGPFRAPALLGIPQQEAPLTATPMPHNIPIHPQPQPLPETPPPLSASGLAQICQQLELAPKTLHKLVADKIWRQLQEFTFSSDEEVQALAVQLKEEVADSLFQILETYHFNQVQVARALQMSRNTLLKLMHSVGLRRPKDLTPEQIEAARNQAGDDINRMARLLRVSPQGLKNQITLLNLEQQINSSD